MKAGHYFKWAEKSFKILDKFHSKMQNYGKLQMKLNTLMMTLTVGIMILKELQMMTTMTEKVMTATDISFSYR